MNQLLENILLITPLFITIICVIVVLFFINWLLIRRKPEIGNEGKLPRQLIMLVLTLAGALSIILALPVSESTRNQLIGLIGVLLSAVVAFSSSTIISNFMAGIMLRINKPFKTGDFIHVGEHFGRVAERGLFDTEIQTEYRELVALPNTFLITTPVTVVRTSGTIISANFSLGYDVHHSRIQSLLISAAQEAGLNEPFVQIIELGNYAVSYRVSGLLTEIKSMLTTRSILFRQILDTLHTNGIEIVSPTFMNQRPMDKNIKTIPTHEKNSRLAETAEVEQIVFDKAEQAEQLENTKQNLIDKIKELENKLKASENNEKERIEELIKTKRNQLEKLDNPEK